MKVGQSATNNAVLIVVAVIGLLGSVASAGVTAILTQRSQAANRPREDFVAELLSRAQSDLHLEINLRRAPPLLDSGPAAEEDAK